MLKSIRVVLAIISFLLVTALFVDVTGYARHYWGWMAKVQFVPALLSLNVLVIVALVGVTLLFGRVYCSTLCPLGVYQDAVNRVSILTSARKKKAGKFKSKSASGRLRVGFFIVFAGLLLGSLFTPVAMSLASLLEPYSAYGRMASTVAGPGMTAVLAVAAVTFICVTLMAWTHGRDYCNKVCPVGYLLGQMSRKSLYRISIDTGKCNGCGSCARHCKASCIDPKTHVVDYTRCVGCFDCIGECAQEAISFTRFRAPAADAKGDPAARRAFLLGGMALTGTLIAEAIDKTTDGGLAPIKQKKKSVTAVRLAPAGSRGARDLSDKCTACQLCITACPNDVLGPSSSLDSLMQPVMAFNKGWCRPECTTCSKLCPTGAITPIDTVTKSSIKIGTATVDLSACISASYGQACGNCSRHCPAGAITMIAVSETNTNLRPMVDENACIGCGSCEYHCPVGRAGNIPGESAAIHVEGIEKHHLI